ncbi:MAG TPA: hypothetical protein VGG28_33290 [Kofleriaceae bacterium]|jgi:hypothetical protein
MKKMLIVSLFSLIAAACGGKSSGTTTPSNTTGNMGSGATGGSSYGGAMGSGSAMGSAMSGGDPCGG